jgi:hypothetical protein
MWNQCYKWDAVRETHKCKQDDDDDAWVPYSFTAELNSQWPIIFIYSWAEQPVANYSFTAELNSQWPVIFIYSWAEQPVANYRVSTNTNSSSNKTTQDKTNTETKMMMMVIELFVLVCQFNSCRSQLQCQRNQTNEKRWKQYRVKQVELPICLTNEALRQEGVWGVDVQSHIFLTSALIGGEWSASRPCRFTPGERAPDTHWIGWVGSRSGLDAVEKRKFLTLPGLELRPLGRLSRGQSLCRLHMRYSTSW